MMTPHPRPLLLRAPNPDVRAVALRVTGQLEAEACLTDDLDVGVRQCPERPCAALLELGPADAPLVEQLPEFRRRYPGAPIGLYVTVADGVEPLLTAALKVPAVAFLFRSPARGGGG